ncbi:MAG: hypothetical protein M3Q29_16580 [Chloroflexota bacterium]|nr:hypothetical protein [Chloroflexota bacterium]
MSQETIDEMETRGSDADVGGREAAALAFAEHMTLNARAVPDEVWIELRQHFDEGEIVEVAAVAALFNGFNRFNDALEVEVTR